MTKQTVDKTIICDEVDETALETVLAQGTATDNNKPPVPANQFKNFKLIQKLGSGGSGAVFLAHDNQLHRDVAIKMLAPGHSVMIQTLLAEARMQAKIEHPNICKIYQVEEADTNNTNSYLVMQYIPGKSAQEWLKEQQNTANPEQIVTLMQKVCDGLQALHQEGIIHRDIKPANIMFAEDSKDGIHPYVVDFGLANHNEAINNGEGKSVIAGTPSFMSPEQWQGTALDRRSDVYSFGATLYQLLTGLQPLSIKVSPHPAKRFDSPQWQELPADLKAIIYKCMQPLRKDRYQSARQVNEELQRYLTGEPVLSLPSKTYWLKKKLFKHKWQTSLVMFITISLIGFIGWQSYQTQQNALREQLIQQFHQSIQQAESTTLLAYTSPQHNTEYLQTTLLENQQQILVQAESLGQIARPFALYAQGRIAQQTGDNANAQKLLSEAWQAGYQTSQSAFALVTTLDLSYQRALGQLYTMPEGELRKTQLKQLKRKFVEPIVAYLSFIKKRSSIQNGGGIRQNGHAVYVDALLDYYNKDFSSALSKLNNSLVFPAWSYRQFILMGNIYIEKYQQASLVKASGETVQQWITKALEAFDNALKIAPSDYHIYLSKQRLYMTIVSNLQYGKGDPGSAIQTSIDFATTANQLNTQQPNTIITLATGIFQLSIYQYTQDLPSKSTLDSSLQLIEQAQNKWPDNLALKSMQARILSRFLKTDSQIEELTQERYIEVDSIYQYLNSQSHDDFKDLVYHGLHLKRWGDFLIAQPKQAKQKYNAAIAAFERAVAVKPEYSGSYINMALTHLKLTSFDSLTEKYTRLDHATVLLQQALQRGHSEFVANFYLARALEQQAQTIGSSDITKAKALLDEALLALQQAETVKPNNFHIRHLRLNILLQIREFNWYLDLPSAAIEAQVTRERLDMLKERPDNLNVLLDAIFVISTFADFNLKTNNGTQSQLALLSQLSKRLQSHNKTTAIALSNLIYARLVLLKSTISHSKVQLDEVFGLTEQLNQLPASADSHQSLGGFYLAKQRSQNINNDPLTIAIKHWGMAIALEERVISYQDSLIKGYLLQFTKQYLLHPATAQKTLTEIEIILSQLKSNIVFFNFHSRLISLLKARKEAPAALSKFLNQANATTNFKREVALMLLDNMSQ
ncbi:MAG: serine/threonine protein kinase [Algicola sp.]|nr:serine/threonine protein kinase [Algicola sp.]